MQIWDIVAPLDLTGFARDVYTPDNEENTLNRFLPDREILGVRSQVARKTRVRTVAMYRAFNAETPIGSRNVKAQVTEINLPPIGQKLLITEWERLWLEFKANTGSFALDAMIQQAYDDTENNVEAIRNRLELARGDLLLDGKFTLAGENNLYLEADYGLTSDQTPTAAASWAASGTDILGSEIALVQQFRKQCGRNPTAAIVSPLTTQRMLKNESYRRAYWAGTATLGPNLNQEQMRSVRISNGLPPLVEYDHSLVVDGVAKRVLPEDQYILVADGLGETQWGTTAESLDLVGSNAVDFTARDTPGIFAAAYKEVDPVTGWTKATAVAMPVLADKDAIISLDTVPGA